MHLSLSLYVRYVCECAYSALARYAARTNKNNNNAAASNERRRRRPALLCRSKSHYHTSTNYITIYLYVSRMNYTNRIQ